MAAVSFFSSINKILGLPPHTSTFDWKEMAPCSFEDDNDVKKENRKAKVHVRRTVLEPADWHRPL